MVIPASPWSIRWHPLRKAQGRLDALVVVLVRPQDLAFAKSLAAQWGEAVPHCHFLAGRADFQPGRALTRGLGQAVSGKARGLGLQPAQTILIGVGESARCAFDAVMFGGLSGLGAILVDMAPLPVSLIAPAIGAALRFVRHSVENSADDPARRDFNAMVNVLRRTPIDLRTMTLPDGPEAAGRAIGGYLTELVARASWYRNLPTPAPVFASPSSSESQS